VADFFDWEILSPERNPPEVSDCFDFMKEEEKSSGATQKCSNTEASSNPEELNLYTDVFGVPENIDWEIGWRRFDWTQEHSKLLKTLEIELLKTFKKVESSFWIDTARVSLTRIARKLPSLVRDRITTRTYYKSDITSCPEKFIWAYLQVFELVESLLKEQGVDIPIVSCKTTRFLHFCLLHFPSQRCKVVCEKSGRNWKEFS
jgi:hypothetical protein